MTKDEQKLADLRTKLAQARDALERCKRQAQGVVHGVECPCCDRVWQIADAALDALDATPETQR